VAIFKVHSSRLAGKAEERSEVIRFQSYEVPKECGEAGLAKSMPEGTGKR